MENRRENILAIRPDLGLKEAEYHSVLEEFQNKTLRPILKLQHTICKRLLLAEKNFDRKIFKQNNQDIGKALMQYLKSNSRFRNQIIAMIVGMMTVEEFELYLENRSECNRRIISMQIKRYMDTFVSGGLADY